jgi:hypothetical protein
VATLDATTAAEYAAEVNASDRAQVVVDALTAPVYGRVYNADGTLMGSGTMTSPWATVSGDKVIPATLSGFFVSVVDDINDFWYFRFESGSRYVRLSFGLAGSGKETEWSLPTFDLGTQAGISSSEITATGNRPPVWSGAPATTVLSSGGTQNFSTYASDPDGDVLTFSLVGATGGYSITSAGVLTAGSASQSVTIRVTDSNGLYADHVCAVTVGSSSVKFTPGHYMTVYNWNSEGDTQAKRLALYDSIASESAIKGVNFMMRWGWKEMESSFGAYTLDWLQTELDYLHARGKKMIFWPFFGRFSGAYSDAWRADAVPAYANSATYDYGIASVNGGIAALYRHWNPTVRARLDALCIAIGQRFDSHPAFEAFRPFCESSFNVDGLAAGAHETALLSSISTTLLAIKPYFPTTVLYSCVSWVRNLGTLFPILAANGFGGGGTDQFPWPDNYPGGDSAQKTDSDDVYFGRGDDQGNQIGVSYEGVIPYWNDNQDPVYGGKEGFWIPAEIYAEGVKKKQTHMTWTRMFDPILQSGGGAGFDRTDMTFTTYRTTCRWATGILPFLRANPNTWATRPSSIS